MPSRPDLRELASNVRDAFADADRDTLLDVLTFVLKEYVVEGPPPMLIHQAETLADLRGASFAQLITAMQTRFDHPELAMFAVDGEQVGVRVGGVVQPLIAARLPMGTAAELPRPAAGLRVVETTLAQRPQPAAAAAPSQPAAAPAQAPPPSRGLSIRGQPSGAGPAASGGGGAPSGGGGAPSGGAPPASGGAASPSSGAASPSSGAPSNDKPEGTGGDDASARFSLLELD
jgi:hypothetical protein